MRPQLLESLLRQDEELAALQQGWARRSHRCVEWVVLSLQGFLVGSPCVPGSGASHRITFRSE